MLSQLLMQILEVTQQHETDTCQRSYVTRWNTERGGGIMDVHGKLERAVYSYLGVMGEAALRFVKLTRALKD